MNWINRTRQDTAHRTYLCTQCFTTHDQNDILFAAQRTTSKCDMRQAAHRRSLCTEEEFAQWCAQGKTRVLLNWRTFPENFRRWENGAITAVRDLDGNWVTQKVCPFCHHPLKTAAPVVFGWCGDGMYSETATGLIRTATQADPLRFRKELRGTLPVPYQTLERMDGTPLLKIPAALERAKGTYGDRCRHRCCTAAAGAVVLLEVEWKAGKLNDMTAFQTIDAFLESCDYTGSVLSIPVVFLLEGLQYQEEEPLELLQREGAQLYLRIEYGLKRRYFVIGKKPQAAVDAVDWLIREMGYVN